MGSTYGRQIKVSIFGESHGAAIGVVVDGLPAGLPVNEESINAFLQRRAPGQSKMTTPRKEKDKPIFLSGVKDGFSCGTPLAAIIENENTRSVDYDNLKEVPRPGHGDFTGMVKYGAFADLAGGGHFSGRLTAPLCIAGAIFKDVLQLIGVEIVCTVVEIGGCKEEPYAEIEKARLDLDSVGGIVKCTVKGLPAGVGDPMFDGLEGRISQAVFAIPAVKAIEFGSGFDGCKVRGSENNDPFMVDENTGQVVTKTNNCGGILGGISTGGEIEFKVGFKPTPSIGKAQQSVNVKTNQVVELKVKGRHDPCIVPRALPCVEAATALALIDSIDLSMLLGQNEKQL